MVTTNTSNVFLENSILRKLSKLFLQGRQASWQSKQASSRSSKQGSFFHSLKKNRFYQLHPVSLVQKDVGKAQTTSRVWHRWYAAADSWQMRKRTGWRKRSQLEPIIDMWWAQQAPSYFMFIFSSQACLPAKPVYLPGLCLHACLSAYPTLLRQLNALFSLVCCIYLCRAQYAAFLLPL